ncbi:hypothetical protein D5086_032527, partial [Populus alba]
WDDSAKMRMLMRQCGVSKTPGCSWIDVGARAHEFHAGDSLHHHSGMEVLVNQSIRETSLQSLALIVENWKYDKAKARRRKRRSEILKCILLCQCFKQVENAMFTGSILSVTEALDQANSPSAHKLIYNQ